jgi:hypothetical protein
MDISKLVEQAIDVATIQNRACLLEQLLCRHSCFHAFHFLDFTNPTNSDDRRFPKRNGHVALSMAPAPAKGCDRT